MKTRQVIILISVLCLCYTKLYSQDPCKVLKQEIAEKYNGKCKKGFAHGIGIAEGIDKYEGQFKNGIPDGNGKYTWANGEVYDGKWKNGKKDGKGKLLYKKNGVDSVKIGIWENDVFIRKIIPPPYIIRKSVAVGRYSIRKIGDGNKVFFSFMQNGLNNNTITNFSMNSTTGVEYTFGYVQGIRDIIFPCTCKVTYSSQNALRTNIFNVEFEIEIDQPGEWEIVIDN